MIYKYKFIDNYNNTLIDKGEFNCESEVLGFLEKKDYKVIWIKEDNKGIILKNRLRKVRLNDLQFFLYRLYILTSSNINLPKSIELLAKEENNRNNKKIYFEILDNLNEGNSLYYTINKIGVFPQLMINMIKIGEESSNLSVVFYNLSEYYKKEINFNKKIKSALYYPMLLILVTFIIINFLTITILPQFLDIFYENNAKVPLTTKILMNMSYFFNNNSLYIIMILLVFIIFLIVYYRTDKGKIKSQKLILKNRFYKNFQLKKFIGEMCLLLNSKITLYNALEIVSDSMNNKIIESEIKTIVAKLNRGMDFSTSIVNSVFFSDLFISLIEVSENTARADEIFNSLNKMYAYEIEIRQEKFIKLLEPAIIIILALIVGFVVLAIAVPMFDIVNGIY